MNSIDPVGKPQQTIEVEGVALHLAHPDEISIRWIGQHETMKQLLAAWSIVDDEDLPMNPRLLGKPGVGKTTLAYAAGRSIERPVYIFQATMDTRPEDLLVTPVVDKQGSIRYVASSLVTAMIRGGVAILDEGCDRMVQRTMRTLDFPPFAVPGGPNPDELNATVRTPSGALYAFTR